MFINLFNTLDCQTGKIALHMQYLACTVTDEVFNLSCAVNNKPRLLFISCVQKISVHIFMYNKGRTRSIIFKPMARRASSMHTFQTYQSGNKQSIYCFNPMFSTAKFPRKPQLLIHACNLNLHAQNTNFCTSFQFKGCPSTKLSYMGPRLESLYLVRAI